MAETPKKHTSGGSQVPGPFQSKVLWIWLAVLMAMALLWSFSREHASRQSLSVKEVIQKAEAGQLLELQLKADPSGGPQWYALTGRMLHQPPHKAAAQDASKQKDAVDAQTPAVGQTSVAENPSNAPNANAPNANAANANAANAANAKSPNNSAAAASENNSKSADGLPANAFLFRAQGRLTDERYDALTGPEVSYLVSQKPASNLFRELLIGVLPLLLFVGLLYYLFARQMNSAGRGAMSFGKSRARMLSKGRDKVYFKDVAGCDEAKEEVSEIIEFLKNPKKFQKIGGRIPKGVLMVGPPGTGKTLLAKAVAGEAEVPFFSISGSDFVEMFVGVGASRVRDMFEQGRKNAPCIVFIDEIDAVGRQRGVGVGGGNDEREQTLNSLLVEMDGFEGHEGVIIMAATNRPDVLDNALLRPGRFDRQVMIDLPDLRGREAILKVHARKIKLSHSVELEAVARSTSGFSGADLANVLNEAALLAARFNCSQVESKHIEEARDKIAYGRERRKLMDDEDKRMTAYHEAGHALIQALLKSRKLKLHKVTIIPRGRALGMTMSAPIKDILGESRNELLDRICVLMAGRIGEEVETGDFSNGASSDIDQATNIAQHMVYKWGMSDIGAVALKRDQDHYFSDATAEVADAEVQSIIQIQYKRAESLMREHRPALKAIAEALLKHETIEGMHVVEIIEHGEIQSEIRNFAPELEPSEPDAQASDKLEGSGDSKDGVSGTIASQPA